MSNSQDDNTKPSDHQFTSDELDTLGEVMNISMGSAATSLSSMLDRQVVITIPKMSVKEITDQDYNALEPAMVVKIEFVEGVFGTNVMVFRRRDMQIILNLLMGNDDVPDEDATFEFDDLSMSAACEVANQMMGSAATALSEVFNCSVNISTPNAFVTKEGESINQTVFGSDTVENMVGISFDLIINGVMNSNFISMLPTSFAKEIVDILMDFNKDEKSSPTSQTAPVPQSTPTPQKASVPQSTPTPQKAPVPQSTPTPQAEPVPQSTPTPQATSMPQPTDRKSVV